MTDDSARAAVAALDLDAFVNDFLLPGRPVLVRGALASWPWEPPWDFASLTERFGDHRVPLYDTLFALHGYSTFRRYVISHTGDAAAGTPPYLRWFARQSRAHLPWADRAFAELASDWTMPAWLPDADYAFPRTSGTVTPVRDPFPAKGLFICGRGGRTRLHVDPWASDACLCQAVGSKRVTMFPPAAAALLTSGSAVVDPDDADDQAFPRWREAMPAFDEVLHPGDAVFIPAGWFHSAVALTDSVSITWNFVHRLHEARFTRYLDAGGVTDQTVQYFLPS